MNHAELIKSIIDKYQGTAIEADIRKVIKYLESHYRMFSLHFVKDRPLPAMSKIDAEMDAIAAPYEGDADAMRSINSVLLATADAISSDTPGSIAKIKEQIAAIGDHELQEAARKIAMLALDMAAISLAERVKFLPRSDAATEARQ